MKERKVKLATAKLAKEKKFNVQVTGCWATNFLNTKRLFFPDERYSNITLKSDKNGFTRPTLDLLQKWLREKHNIKVIADSHTKNSNGEWIDWVVSINGKLLIDARDGFDTYEEALEYGLQEGLKLIKI